MLLLPVPPFSLYIPRPQGSAASGPTDLLCLETCGPKLLTSSPSWPAGRSWLQRSREFKVGGREGDPDAERFLSEKNSPLKTRLNKSHAKQQIMHCHNRRQKSEKSITACGQRAAFIAFMAFIACGKNMTGQRWNNKTCNQHQP